MCKKKGILVGYVDDGAYSYASPDPYVLSQVLTDKYNKLEDWMNANKLVINPDKTHLMVMTDKKNSVKRKHVAIKAVEHIIKPTEKERCWEACSINHEMEHRSTG